MLPSALSHSVCCLYKVLAPAEITDVCRGQLHKMLPNRTGFKGAVFVRAAECAFQRHGVYGVKRGLEVICGEW